jgi:amino acid adenylation domain-containing protein
MPNQSQFSCFLIGEETLLIQCAEILIKKEHQILGILSSNKLITDWAKLNGINITLTDEIIATLSHQPFDFLFGFDNSLASNEIVDLPCKYIINFHDSLLPKYAGENSTSWALVNQEKTHGVTWYLVNKLINGGDILKQVSIDINAIETAFTLKLKCYDIAVQSFTEIVDDLSLGQAVVIPQDLKERSHFPLTYKPKSGGVLDFSQCAYKLDSLIRALEFGSYPNPLGKAKLLIENDFVVVSKIEVLDDLSQSIPGIITAIESNFIRVSTKTNDVLLSQLQTQESQPISITDFVGKFKLKIGYQFKNIQHEIAMQIEMFNSSIASHEAFWVERLMNFHPITIPYAVKSDLYLKEKQFKDIKTPILDEVASFLERQRPDWNLGDFLLFAFVGYLSRISGNKDFDIGLGSVELSEITGFFAPCVPYHLDIDTSQSFEDFFVTAQDQIKLTKHHKTYARDVVCRYPILRERTDLQSEQIFPVVVIFLQTAENPQYHPGNELTFIISEDVSECCWLYNTNAFDYSDINMMLEQFTIFMQGIMVNTHQSLAYLPLLSEHESHKILVKWNDTAADYPKDKCIYQLFEEQAERTPNLVAVTFENEKLTYQELNSRANQLAHYLQELGVGSEVLVGVCFEQSLETLVALLGILKAGGAYLPLDPTYPENRLLFMVEETGVGIILTKTAHIQNFNSHHTQIFCLDSYNHIIAQKSKHNIISKAIVNSTAYVIFTSGSTGKPKGITIPHSGICNQVLWRKTSLKLTETDNVLQVSPFNFDPWLLVFCPLLAGSQLFLPSSHGRRDPAYLTNLMLKSKISVLFGIVPSALEALLKEPKIQECNDLRLVAFGGELRSADFLKQYFSVLKAELHNNYGPTEASISSTSWKCEADINLPIIPVGRPISNVKIYILDPNLQPLPVGVVGEIHIGGAGLARGYLNQPTLTAKAFISNPFSNEPGSRLYKTGDLGCYLPDGNIKFISRLDSQVKIRGFRIQLEEIEVVLTQHPRIKQATVIVREDNPGDKRLVAYVVPNQKQMPTTYELRHVLKQKLPDYMVPFAFIFLDILPLTPNGKIDRRNLPAPDQSRSIQSVVFEAPCTPTEQKLADVWCSVMNLKYGIGIHDNFFDLGGHSLMAAQVISRVRQIFGIELPLRILFEAPTIIELEDRIKAIQQITGDMQKFNIHNTDGWEEIRL